MEAVVQMELIPSAKEEDIQRTIYLLRYELPQWESSVKVLKKIKEYTPEQLAKLESYQNKIELVETAISTILDKEARDIIKHRYLKTDRRKDTISFFGSIMSESTIDRRIDKGLLSVANTLKDCGII
ncbi:hypothetical protein BK126_03040 [Paenibacillus sp. FSL H7-0326]|uniref:hypothetical protein n=1 Tax=Paenibacillus sp. FSL H7-0326 TaxID=1921144 RepID=UPI00096F2B2A|nr:hypothetical protein [Paenibacillus sp. FSL H7-0326]OMC71103.1 hypothetical protein BK126_03040 [Paenibacillus sp. FSL H7-0326]